MILGRNFNAGEVIQLVLRSPSTGQWLPFKFVQMVMMRECFNFLELLFLRQNHPESGTLLTCHECKNLHKFSQNCIILITEYKAADELAHNKQMK